MAAIAVRIPSVMIARISAIEVTSCNVYLSDESTSWLEGGCRARCMVAGDVACYAHCVLQHRYRLSIKSAADALGE